MSLKNIEKHSVSYALFKYWVKFWHDKIYYRRVEYVHRKGVPLNEHLIVTANHQNALMDALAIELAFYNQPVFVARSDIFANKWVASILYWLKILPVYRIRDGYESLKKNEMIFQKTIDIILNNNSFVIMPEGNHAGIRRLRPFKKGFARIAFQTEAANNYSLNIKIVPVGIDYESYTSYRSTLLVNFGEPMDISGFYNDYKVNPPVALNKIKAALSERIKPLMIDIESEAYYDLYNELRRMYRPYFLKKQGLNPKKLYDGFRADKQLIAALKAYETRNPGKMEYYSELMATFVKGSEEAGFGERELQKNNVSMVKLWANLLLLLVASPLFLYGFLLNALPYHLPRYLVRNIKDKQFHSSFKFVITLLAFPVFYLVEAGIFCMFNRYAWGIATFIISLPVSAFIAWQWFRLFKITKREGRFLCFKRRKQSAFAEISKTYNRLIAFAEHVLYY